MAGFIRQDVRTLEAKIGHCLISIPMHPENRIDEGSASIISKIEVRGKPAAVKNFKQQLPMLKILKMACTLLRELQHPNIVRFRGYSARPSALLFEFCEINVHEEVVHNDGQLISIFNAHNYFCLIESVDYIYQATLGLQYLHHNRISH